MSHHIQIYHWLDERWNRCGDINISDEIYTRIGRPEENKIYAEEGCPYYIHGENGARCVETIAMLLRQVGIVPTSGWRPHYRFTVARDREHTQRR